MMGQTILASVAMAAEPGGAAEAVANAVDTPAAGHGFAFAIALAAFFAIGTLLSFHRWSRRRAER